jgi:hypothetical protein
MNETMVFIVNCGFTWLIVLLSVMGYLVTLRRTHQQWPLWFILAIGWAFLAIPNTLLVVGIPIARAQLTAIWLSSYLLVMASLLLLFLKLVDLARRQSKQ